MCHAGIRKEANFGFGTGGVVSEGVSRPPAEPGQNSQESPPQNKLGKPPGTKTVTGEAAPAV